MSTPIREDDITPIATEKLAVYLKTARALTGITQEELAEKSGISRATLFQIESGKGNPRLSTVESLVKFFKVPFTLT
jgi:DNA-binding XRE family transcriptional regulator